MLLNTLVSRKSHVVWSLGRLEHKGKNAQRNRILKVFCWKRDHVDRWSGGLHCTSLETKGKYPGAKGLRGAFVSVLLQANQNLTGHNITLDHGFISLNKLANSVGENFIYRFCIHRMFDKDKQVGQVKRKPQPL